MVKPVQLVHLIILPPMDWNYSPIADDNQVQWFTAFTFKLFRMWGLEIVSVQYAVQYFLEDINQAFPALPSGKLRVRYWKWPFGHSWFTHQTLFFSMFTRRYFHEITIKSHKISIKIPLNPIKSLLNPIKSPWNQHEISISQHFGFLPRTSRVRFEDWTLSWNAAFKSLREGALDDRRVKTTLKAMWLRCGGGFPSYKLVI